MVDGGVFSAEDLFISEQIQLGLASVDIWASSSANGSSTAQPASAAVPWRAASTVLTNCAATCSINNAVVGAASAVIRCSGELAGGDGTTRSARSGLAGRGIGGAMVRVRVRWLRRVSQNRRWPGRSRTLSLR